MLMYPSVGFVYDPIMGKHRSAQPHNECPERIYTLSQTLTKSEYEWLLTKIPSREATFNELCLAHTKDYVTSTILKLNSSNPYIDSSDTYCNESTLVAAKTAAGSCLNMVNDERITRGFAIVRPPGHHATPNECMGFCFFNNIAISAIHLAKKGKRVLIVDWDVHHGNGTEEIIKNNTELPILFFSIQREDIYPGTGKTNIGDKIINVGFKGSQGDSFYLDMFKNILYQQARDFKPDVILVSCGFDAALGDPLGQCFVTPEGYYKMTEILKEICPSVYMILEGGYNLQIMGECFVVTLKSLLNLKF